jgi:nitrite reductase/ring-hydroxylating ferredoxin subunit
MGHFSLLSVNAAGWTKVSTTKELATSGGKKVVETEAGRILLAEVEGTVFAVSNKCSHLGLPLVGKTAMFQGEARPFFFLPAIFVRSTGL